MNIFNWFNETFLKMTWLYDLVWKIITGLFDLDSSDQIGNILHFFLYDTIKIFILLGFLIFLISYI